MTRCPNDNSPLRVDQTYTDSRPDGLGGYGTEITHTVVVWACKQCGYTRSVWEGA